MRIGRHRLAARRIAVGLTQEGLAERLEVAVSTVARWEQGATAPRAWQRGRLAEALELTLNQLDELLAPDMETAVAPEVAGTPDSGRSRPSGRPGPSGSASASAPATEPVPRVQGFVGRVPQVDEVVAALDDHLVTAVMGRRGVGTSACACKAVQVSSDRGPTRPAVYADLRGRSSSRPPSLELLAADAIAAATAATAGEALLVLDNVDDPAIVQGLVPPPDGCRLLLVGHPELVDLGTVHPVPIEELTAADAAALFEVASTRDPTRDPGPVGSRTDPTVRELVDLCGRQPRAIAALAREITHGHLDLDGSLEALRLAGGAPPHRAVRFFLAAATVADEDVAYDALRTPSQRLFRRLGLVGSEPLALEAMAKLAGRSIKQIEALVAELSHGRFVRPVPSVASAEVTEGGRYQVRPLLTTYARLHLRRDEPVWRRVRAQVRLVRYLARKAERHAVRPSRAGREWFECHQPLLAAVVASATALAADQATPLPRPVRRWWFRLAAALCRWYADEDRLDDWWAACDAVHQATVGRRAPVVGRLRNELGTLWGRPAVRGWALNERGVILRRQGDARAAIAELTKALPRRGRRGEAQVLTNRGLAFLDVDAVDAAIADFKRAVKGRSQRDHVGLGLTEMGLGVAYLRSGAASDARRHLVKAADAFDRARDLRGAAAARANLVLAEWETGAHNAAAEAGRVALDKYAELERLTGRADAAGHDAAVRNLAATTERALRRSEERS
ncbi:MAG: helix-turn-helix domain-containing protein [Acidimicrobiales bacterium]